MAFTAINKASEYFNTKIYTGNSAASHALTGVGHQPDLTWIKNRDNTDWHMFTDSTRGATKTMYTNDAYGQETTSNILLSWQSDGFTVGDGGSVNNNTQEYVAWNWKANGGTTASNSDGTITTTIQANTTSGFSIISYTGTGSNATLGHGLTKAPQLVIIKRLEQNTYNWNTLPSSISAQRMLSGNAKVVYLDLDNAEADSSTAFNDTMPTSSVISIGTKDGTNESGKSYMAYCWHEVKGYSKIGEYATNNNTDGPFIFTGFKPNWFMVKNADTASTSWVITDIKRSINNITREALMANANSAEQTYLYFDILSNGFKVRIGSASNWVNGTADKDIVYMAFADHPMVSTNNVISLSQ